MPLTKRFILLIFFVLQTSFLFSQKGYTLADSIRARELNKTAIGLYQNGMHSKALDTFFCGLELRKKIYGNEHYNLGAVYSGIGIVYRGLGQFDLALKYYNLAEKNYLLSSRFKTRQKAKLYMNIGNAYRSKLDFNSALQYFNQTLAIYQNSNKYRAQDISNVNYKIADIYYLKNDFQKALELIRQNIEYAYADDKIRYYVLLAFINQIQLKKVEAKTDYEKAIELTIGLYGKDHINVAIEYLNYAQFLLSDNEFEESEKVLEKTYKIIKQIQPIVGYELANYYNLRGDLLRNTPIKERDLSSFMVLKRQNLEEAIQWYSKALSAIKFPINNAFGNPSGFDGTLSLLASIKYLKKIATTFTEIAVVEQDKKSGKYIGVLTEAINYYKLVGTLIQKARMETVGDEGKIQLTELEYSTSGDLIRVAFDVYTITNDNQFIELAFQSAERTKGSAVFDKLSDAKALENSLIPDSLIRLENKLNSTVSVLSEKLYVENSEKSPNKKLVDEYKTKIFAATRKRGELNRYLEKEYSDYYDLKYSASMLSIAEIRKKLSNNDVILEYVLNEKDSSQELFTFVISKFKIDFTKQIVDTGFTQAIETVFHFMATPQYNLTTNSESIAFCVASNQLYKKLIEPLNPLIQKKNITIVPDGKLSYLAFDGLLKSLPDTSKTIQFNRLDYLIKDFSINYSISSNLLFKKGQAQKKIWNKVVAFAPDYHSGTFEFANQKITLIPLPGVQKEVDIISEEVSTKVFRGAEATVFNFRRNINNCDILHLAMHAYLNDSLPAFSRLAFSPGTLKNMPSDGWLTNAEVYNLNLGARLTVLSACNTGSGSLREGEGIMSMARGFFYAGCPAIIMSLWEVEDRSGTQIMGAFYKNLKKGKSKAEALRHAKLEYLKTANSRRAHPHYWLGYVNIGDNSPLYKSYDFYFFFLLIIALIAISVDQSIRIKKARKKRAS